MTLKRSGALLLCLWPRYVVCSASVLYAVMFVVNKQFPVLCKPRLVMTQRGSLYSFQTTHGVYRVPGPPERFLSAYDRSKQLPGRSGSVLSSKDHALYMHSASYIALLQSQNDPRSPVPRWRLECPNPLFFHFRRRATYEKPCQVSTSRGISLPRDVRLAYIMTDFVNCKRWDRFQVISSSDRRTASLRVAPEAVPC